MPLRLMPVVVAALVMATIPASARAATAYTVVAAKLDNPRGMVAGPDGALYVAEAGHAGKTCLPDSFCTGRTAAITRIKDGRAERIATGLPSFGDRTGAFASGAADVAVAADGSLATVVTSLGRRIPKGVPKPSARFVGRIVRIGAGGALTPGAAVDRIEFTRNPDRENRDSNPYSLTFSGSDLFVADAGGNDLLRVSGAGVSAAAVFGHPAPRAQSVPTVVRPGPDGALYIGELSGDRAPNGRSRVWRYDPASGAPPTVYATGFTRITGLAFGPDGSLYVSEFSRDLARSRAAGDVMRVAPDGTRTRIGADVLRFPSGLAVLDGALYVANWSGATARPVKAGPAKGRTGQVVRIALGR